MADGFRTPDSRSGGLEIRLNFTLEHWCLWQSEESPVPQCWPGGEILPYNGGQADVGFMPAVHRRRLSPLAAAACAVAWRGRLAAGDVPAVFYSSHGESLYYFEMLESMAAGEKISPTRFSLSVHNAVAGQFGIHTGSRLPYVCLAGGTEGLFAAFLEAAGLLLELPKVLLVCYEQPLPEAWQSNPPQAKTTWAVAMVLACSGEVGRQLRLVRESAGEFAGPENGDMGLVQAILCGKRSGDSRFSRAHWHWNLEGA